MIISKISGGLGNQMFQYAFGRHLSNKLKKDFRQEISFYNFQGVVKRNFCLNQFINTKINLDLTNIDGNIYQLNEPSNFISLNLNSNLSYYLDGYWQSENYFIESEKIIREDFSPSESIKQKIFYKYPELNYNSVSLHIRRTDYIHMGKSEDVSNQYYIIQPYEYYESALNIIGEYDNLFIISDDIEWCKNNLNYKNIIFVEGNSDIEDMYIMSFCKNNIIANSTFSWWGAWINSNDTKKIVTPSKWYGPKINGNISELIPTKWIKIKN